MLQQLVLQLEPWWVRVRGRGRGMGRGRGRGMLGVGVRDRVRIRSLGRKLSGKWGIPQNGWRMSGSRW